MIQGLIVGQKALVDRIRASHPELKKSLKQTVEKISLTMLAKVKLKLSDDVLHVRSGRLRRSVNNRVSETGNTVTGTVGTNVVYGRYWEQGFERKVGAGARGGPKTLAGKARDSYFAKHPPGTKHYGPKAFLKPSLEESKAMIRAKLKDALAEVVARVKA